MSFSDNDYLSRNLDKIKFNFKDKNIEADKNRRNNEEYNNPMDFLRNFEQFDPEKILKETNFEKPEK